MPNTIFIKCKYCHKYVKKEYYDLHLQNWQTYCNTKYIHKCPYCLNRYNSVNKLEFHLKFTHKYYDSYTCWNCSIKFKKIKDLYSHKCIRQTVSNPIPILSNIPVNVNQPVNVNHIVNEDHTVVSSNLSVNRDDINICNICYTNKINYALMNCGHCYCESCITRLHQNNKCYICLQPFTDTLKIYL